VDCRLFIYMHAYLIIAKDTGSLEEEIKKNPIFQKYIILEFLVQQIEDARELNAFIRLSLSKKTAILIKNFQNASEECSNAILKNIEEPQGNLIFILHSKSENHILPTIVSRCQVININPTLKQSDTSDIQKFLSMELYDKTDILFKNKKREDALDFSEKMLEYFQEEVTNHHNIKYFSRLVKSVIVLNKSLRLNGNVNLQLLRFLTDISN
jgi:hypothetical protein